MVTLEEILKARLVLLEAQSQDYAKTKTSLEQAITIEQAKTAVP